MRYPKSYMVNQTTMSRDDGRHGGCCFIKWRTWLPPPLRKLFSKNERYVVTGNAVPDAASQLKKTPTYISLKEQHSGTVSTPVASTLRQSELPTGELTEPLAHCEEESTSNTDSAETLMKKCEFVLRELVDTEEMYVADLSLVCEGYMRHMRDSAAEPPLPEGLKEGRDKIVFGNIEAIYEWHRDFLLRELRQCVTQPENLGPLFRRSERKLQMYVVYCQNKPLSDYIVSEYIDTYFENLRQQFGHKLQICDLLIKPVQRIQKYHLLVRDALRHAERGGASGNVTTSLRQAVAVTSVVPKSANDMMDVGRLQGFDGKITAQGRLLLHDILNCTDITNSTEKPKDLQVFFFEQSIIFSEAVGKKTQFTSPSYHYKAHIRVNKMVLEEHESGSSFTVRSTDTRGAPVAFTIRATPRVCQEWISMLLAILQMQRDFLKAILSPIAYQMELTNKSSEKGDDVCSIVVEAIVVESRIEKGMSDAFAENQEGCADSQSLQWPFTKTDTMQPNNLEKPLNLVSPVMNANFQSLPEANAHEDVLLPTARLRAVFKCRKTYGPYS